MSDEPAELPARGQSTPSAREPFDPSKPDASGTNLSLAEAERTFDVSRATLRRRIDDGSLPGAHKRPGPSGEEWALPVASLERLYDRREAAPAAPTVEAEPETPGVDARVLDELLDELRALREDRAQAQRELMAGEEDRRRALEEREAARVAEARAAAEAEAARRDAERLSTELEAERARRQELEERSPWRELSTWLSLLAVLGVVAVAVVVAVTFR